jgi:hypothetical protein
MSPLKFDWASNGGGGGVEVGEVPGCVWGYQGFTFANGLAEGFLVFFGGVFVIYFKFVVLYFVLVVKLVDDCNKVAFG